MSNRFRGIIKDYDVNRGFGFIKYGDPGHESKIFVHIRDVPEVNALEVGQSVEFEVGPGREAGQTKAANVKIIPK
jgi:cold shock CspA family protein